MREYETTLPIDPSPTFVADTSITVPGQPSGPVLRVIYRHKDREALDEWIGRFSLARGDKLTTDFDVLSEVVQGWEVGPVGADKQPLPFTPEAFKRVLNAYPASSRDFFHAYVRELAIARAKN